MENIDSASWLDQATTLVSTARTMGYGHAILAVTEAEKQTIVDGDLLAPLRSDGYSIHPGTTPDFVKQEQGIDACEIIMIKWQRPPLPDRGLAAADKPKKTAAKAPAKKAAKTPAKKAAKPKKKPKAKAPTTPAA